MSDGPAPLVGPDLGQGVPLAQLVDGAMILGHAQGEAILLTRRGDACFAIGASCTHYGGPLAEGLLVGATIRCPWHHACFDLRSGQALRAPALDPVACWRVERRDGTVYVTEKLVPAAASKPAMAGLPAAIVILGGGAAGNAAAEMLRREGYTGRLTLLSEDEAAPYDRPNLSKDYLAGTAPAAWIPLRPAEFYRAREIELRLGTRVAAIDTPNRNLQLADGSRVGYDALLIATGAEPVRPAIPGAGLPSAHYLRTLADSDAIIAKAATAKQAVVIGASFIGLEVAAALRTRKMAVHVAAPEDVPMARLLGADIGRMIRALHEEHGVVFHLGAAVTAIDQGGVTLKSGERLAADLVVIGVGVRPLTALAEQAGLACERGILVDEYLATSVPGIYAAGDIARWPDRLTRERIRVEHWVVAERQGQVAARNMLGAGERFAAIPFFWSQHYDVSIHYVGHAEKWDSSDVDGRPEARDCKVTLRQGDRKLAVITVGRDLASLRAELDFETMVEA